MSPKTRDRIHELEALVETLQQRIRLLEGDARAAQRERETLRRVLDNAPIVVWAVDADGVFTHSEGKGLEALGLRPGEAVGRSAFEMYADTPVVEALRRALAGEAFTSVTRVGERAYETAYTPIRDDDGAVVGVAGISTDVTDRLRVIDALRESEQKFRALVETTCDFVWEVDETLSYVYASPRSRDVLGVEPDACRGRSRFDGIDPQDEPRVRAAWRDAALERRPIHALRYAVAHPDGSRRVVESSAVPICHGDEVVGFRGMDRDITSVIAAERERERLTLQLFHAQKMETIGTLAGGIAHDFNNILSPILGYTDMALESLPEDHPVRGDLEQVLHAARRARELVNQILVFSTRSETTRRVVQPHLVARETLDLVRATLPTAVRVSHHIDAAAGSVLGDAAQIEQVIMNLCTNAAQALGRGGGTLRVAVERVAVRDDDDLCDSATGARVPPGEYVRITVADDGPGMDPETAARVFEPFFTTRDVGEGTGLGLSVVLGIVQSHDGFIVLDTRPGRGTTVRVLLPRVEATADAPTAQAPQRPVQTHGQRILLVDDDPDVACLGARLLESYGYRATALSDPAAAVRLFTDAPHSYDVAIVNAGMPGMNGEDVAGALHAIRADLPVVLTTGDPERLAAGPGSEDVCAVVAKPFVARDLALVIEEATGAVDAAAPPEAS